MLPPAWQNSGANNCSSCCRRLRGGQARPLADNREIAMRILRFGCVLIAAAVACASYCAQAEVTRIEIASPTFTPNTAEETYALDDMGRYADTTRYPPLDPLSAANTLTVRDGFLGAPRPIARDQWQFGRLKDGQLVLDISALYLKGGYEPGHFYELSYEAKGAVVAGLGFAALRDMASAVKHRQGGPI